MAKEPAVPPSLEPLIFAIRGHRVILDADLARLYGVPTKRFNEAFKRNRGRFPDDFAFQISDVEYPQLRSQLSNSMRDSGNWSQFATSSASRRGNAYRPWAFTEHGALIIDPASVTRDVVLIKELVLAAPDVVYERGQGSDNLSVIQKNVDAWVAKNAGAKKSEGPGKKFVLERVVIKDGKAHLGTTLTSPMPDLVLRDVGKKSNGATAGEVVKQVWGAMMRSVTDVALRMGGAVKEGASSVSQSVKKLFR